jgi:altronate hydrolase
LIMANVSMILKLHPQDDVAIARQALTAGARMAELPNIPLRDDIPAAHKLSVRAVPAGEPVRRYGQIIGFATRDIAVGEHVHTHNLAMGEFARDYAFGADRPVSKTSAQPRTFAGILRADGRVATRNYIGVISTVNCSATVTKMVVKHFAQSGALDAYPNVDGIVPITHSFGCCIDHDGEGIRQLRRTLGGLSGTPILRAWSSSAWAARPTRWPPCWWREALRPMRCWCHWSCRSWAARSAPSRLRSGRSRGCCPSPTRCKGRLWPWNT